MIDPRSERRSCISQGPRLRGGDLRHRRPDRCSCASGARSTRSAIPEGRCVRAWRRCEAFAGPARATDSWRSRSTTRCAATAFHPLAAAAPGAVRDGRQDVSANPGRFAARGDALARRRDGHLRRLRRLARRAQPPAESRCERARSQGREAPRRGARLRLARVVRAAARQVVLLRRRASRIHRLPGCRRVRGRLGRPDRRPAGVRRACRRVPAPLPRARMARQRARRRHRSDGTSGGRAGCARRTSATRRSCAPPTSRSRAARSARCASRSRDCEQARATHAG